ncbi:hypothetical protein BC832DRAFT_618399 [Gaertneriomyces semiglobifer]|nr:hypothetical protein BC832DRAFT_618399 [Gaertneriomyces semiglobifer]
MAVLKRHIPLIKFLGPRKFLQLESHAARSTPTPASTQTPQRNGNRITYGSLEQLPARFQRKAWSASEIEAVDAGGASYVLHNV